MKSSLESDILLKQQIAKNTIPKSNSTISFFGGKFNLSSLEPNYTNSTTLGLATRIIDFIEHLKGQHDLDASPKEAIDYFIMAYPAIQELANKVYPNNLDKQKEFEANFRQEVLTKLAIDRYYRDPVVNLTYIMREINMCSSALFTTFLSGSDSVQPSDVRHILNEIAMLPYKTLLTILSRYDINTNPNPTDTASILAIILENLINRPDQLLADYITESRLMSVEHIDDWIKFIKDMMIGKIPEYKQWLILQKSRLENGDYDDLSVPFEPKD